MSVWSSGTGTEVPQFAVNEKRRNLSCAEVDANLPHWLDADLEHEVLRPNRQVGQTREVRVNGPKALDLRYAVWGRERHSICGNRILRSVVRAIGRGPRERAETRTESNSPSLTRHFSNSSELLMPGTFLKYQKAYA